MISPIFSILSPNCLPPPLAQCHFPDTFSIRSGDIGDSGINCVSKVFAVRSLRFLSIENIRPPPEGFRELFSSHAGTKRTNRLGVSSRGVFKCSFSCPRHRRHEALKGQLTPKFDKLLTYSSTNPFMSCFPDFFFRLLSDIMEVDGTWLPVLRTHS